MADLRPEELFARHHRDVYRYLLRMTGNLDAADDLQQEVFLRVVRALHEGRPVGHERGWIFSIARNLAIDHGRNQARRQAVDGPVGEPARPATQALALGVDRALEKLAAGDREMFLMKEVGGLRYDEIAEACGCTVEAVRSRLHRTRAQLRRELSL